MFTVILYVIHFSEAEPKGSDCFDKFVEMQACMKDYPELYEGQSDPLEAEESEDNDKAQEKPDTTSTEQSIEEEKRWCQNGMIYNRSFA